MSYKVAVVGATGNVGREILQVLYERNFPIREVVALASKSSIGREVSFGETKILKVKSLEDFDFSDTDIALFSPGASVSKIHAPRAAEKGCVVIDNTSQFRYDADIPLVVPEVNPDALKNFRKRNIIANPNCSTIQMVVALNPIHEEVGIKRIVVSTYQSVSGAGKDAMDELYSHTKSIYVSEHKEPEVFSKRIVFNVIPQIDVAMPDGSYKEEWKMVTETKKIMGSDIAVSATCVRVPVFVGHSESINIELESELSADDARKLLRSAPGVEVMDNPQKNEFMTPAECVGAGEVFVSRIRKDESVKYGLNLWVVSDNLRKGAALNAVQIAEELIKNYALMPKKVAA